MPVAIVSRKPELLVLLGLLEAFEVFLVEPGEAFLEGGQALFIAEARVGIVRRRAVGCRGGKFPSCLRILACFTGFTRGQLRVVSYRLRLLERLTLEACRVCGSILLPISRFLLQVAS